MIYIYWNNIHRKAIKMATTGVYITKKKDGSISYRVSITYKRKHISLGSYSDYEYACRVYKDAKSLIEDNSISLESYNHKFAISHDKFIAILNFRDNGIYLATPIYIRKQYFEYYLSEHRILKFDRDDLFFYAAHKIQQKGGYLFVSDYGSQYKILSRYGIKPFAVYERDFVMINGDRDDYRYSNIRILNAYIGVLRSEETSTPLYTTTIHIHGNYIVGRYGSEIEAAIAYNKAVDTLHAHGLKKAYIKNYITGITKDEYKNIYESISISQKITDL